MFNVIKQGNNYPGLNICHRQLRKLVISGNDQALVHLKIIKKFPELPRHFRKCLIFLQMPRQFRNFLNCLVIPGNAQSFPEMPDFRNCLRHIYFCAFMKSKFKFYVFSVFQVSKVSQICSKCLQMLHVKSKSQE